MQLEQREERFKSEKQIEFFTIRLNCTFKSKFISDNEMELKFIKPKKLLLVGIEPGTLGLKSLLC